MLSSSDTFWAIIPAAGVGKRIGSDIPKQYILLHQKPILAYGLALLAGHPRIHKVVVALAADDTHWPLCKAHLSPACIEKVLTVTGGAERYFSVYQGLLALQNQAKSTDWVLVHDAVRPCLKQADISHLIHALQKDPVGGLLGVRVCNTLKRTNPAGQVVASVDREGVWQAHTPQMFRYGILLDALQSAIEKKLPITDDAMAIEAIGMQARMVEGPLYNMKITYPEDIDYIEKQAFLEENI